MKTADTPRTRGRGRGLQSWAGSEQHPQPRRTEALPVFLCFIAHLDEKLVSFHTVTEQSCDFRFRGHVAVSCTPDSSITFLTVSKFCFPLETQKSTNPPFPWHMPGSGALFPGTHVPPNAPVTPASSLQCLVPPGLFPCCSPHTECLSSPLLPPGPAPLSTSRDTARQEVPHSSQYPLAQSLSYLLPSFLSFYTSKLGQRNAWLSNLGWRATC